jgi:hypothetical protein
MKDWLIKAATFVRVIDSHDGQLSLTNITLIITLVKLVMIQQTLIADIGALLIAMVAFQAKKLINANASTPVDTTALQASLATTATDVEQLKSKVSSLMMSVGMKTKV